MQRFKDTILDMESLVYYQTENAEFKDEARKLLVDYLGFEPELGASWKQEVRLRLTLKRIQEGTNTPKQLEKQVEVFAGLTKAMMEDLKNSRS